MKVNKYTYNCKENDNRIRFHFKDYEIDEVWVQTKGETSWTVIGYNDLEEALKRAKDRLNKSLHNDGGGYIGEALLNTDS